MSNPSQAPISSFCYCAAILLLGETLFRGAKQFDSLALACAVAALVLVGAPLWLLPFGLNRRWLDGLIAFGVGIGFVRLPMIDLFFRYPASRPLLFPFIALAAIAAMLSSLILMGRPRGAVGGIFGLLLLNLATMGWFYLNLSASPHVDVYVVQNLGCDALLDGHNPFAITYPDIYGPGSGLYPPGVVVDGQVQSGYWYPPLTLLLDLPGSLAGDVRFALLAAILGAAVMLGYGWKQYGLALWLLFTPKMLFILENAWNDVYAVLLLTLVVWAAKERRIWTMSIAAGLLFVSKQYIVLILPAAVLLAPAPWRWKTISRMALCAVLAGSAVTLPFIAINAPAFFRSMTVVHSNIIRSDSISFLPMISHIFGLRLTLLCPVLAAAVASLITLYRAERSASGFAAATAFIGLCMFLFSPLAFINYYFFAIAALLAAVATANSVESAKTAAA